MGVAHAVTLHIKSFTSTRKLLIAFLTITAASRIPVDVCAWRPRSIRPALEPGALQQRILGHKGAEHSNLPTKTILSAFTSNCIRLRPLPIGVGVE